MAADATPRAASRSWSRTATSSSTSIPSAVEPQRREAVARAWEQALARVDLQRRLGLSVEVLSPWQVGARWSHLDPDRLVGATWCGADGFLHPHVIYGEGFRRARELGVAVLQRCEVTGARHAGERIVAVETTRGPVEGDYFVNATNAWAPRTSARVGGMALPIAPTKRYLYHLKITRPIMDEEAWRRLPMTIYGMGPGRGVFSRPDGPQLIVGLSHETDPEPDFADEDQDRIAPGFSHEHGLENLGYEVLGQVAEFSPDLADAGGLAATSCGYYGMTPDANPLIGFDTQCAEPAARRWFLRPRHHARADHSRARRGAACRRRARRPCQLPPPFAAHSIALAAFDPSREFRAEAAESMVI